VEGILPLVADSETRIENGQKAYDALQRLKASPNDPAARAAFALTGRDLGYGLLLKRYVAIPDGGSGHHREGCVGHGAQCAGDVLVFRIMAGIGFLQIAVFAAAFLLVTLRKCDTKWILWTAVLMMPLPWVAAEAGGSSRRSGASLGCRRGVATFLGPPVSRFANLDHHRRLHFALRVLAVSRSG